MDIDAIRQRIEQLQTRLTGLSEQLDATAEQEAWWTEKIAREQQALATGGSRVARDVRELALSRSREQLRKLRDERAELLAQRGRLERDLQREKTELDRAEFLARHQPEPSDEDPLAVAARETESRLREAEAVADAEAAALPEARERASRLVGRFVRSRVAVATGGALALTAALIAGAMQIAGPADAVADVTPPLAGEPDREIRRVVFITIEPLRALGPQERVDAVRDLLGQLPADLTADEVLAVLGETRDQPRASLLAVVKVNIDRASLPADRAPALLGQTAPDPRLAMVQTLAPLLRAPLPTDALLAVIAPLTGETRLAALQALAPHLATTPDLQQTEAILQTLNESQRRRGRILLESRS